MIRTQIQLTEQQAAALKALAAQRGLSMAELIRQGLTVLLETAAASRNAQQERGLSVVGRFHSGRSDISARHDDYLAEDFRA